MLDLPFRSAKQLAADIRRKKIGCLELLDTYLARVDTYNPRLNAIVVTDRDGARRRARAADAALTKGKAWGPLHGVPMTVKESYDVVGMPTTWGAPELKDNRPSRNALAVDRLLGAGVVLFGKSNVPLHARRLAELQRGVRLHQQSLGSRAHAGRLLRRLGRGARRRPDRHRGGERHRRVDPESRALLRRLRPQADLRHRAATRPGACRAAWRSPTSPSSAPWRGAPTISHSGSPRWRAPTRSTGPGGSSACPRRGGSSSASTRSPSCSPTPAPRSTRRCRTGSRPSPTSSRRRRRG